MLVGLAGLAITQPVLDLMGRNPEFFVAGSYTSSQIIWFGAHRRARPVRPAGARVLPRPGSPTRGSGRSSSWSWSRRWAHCSGTCSCGASALDNGARRRRRGDRRRGAGRRCWCAPGRAGMLLQYLAVANVLFLVAFLFMSPVSALVSSDVDPAELGTVSVPVPPGPVVVIVFDELPLPTLMQPDGTINAERFPAFARLAESSTWFRNASSPHNRTERAVPAHRHRQRARDAHDADLQALPRNLLALMGTSVPGRALRGPHRPLPAARRARSAAESRSRQALGDSLIVYGHRVLPPRCGRTWRRSTTRGATSAATCGGARRGAGADLRLRGRGVRDRGPAGALARLRGHRAQPRRPRRPASSSRASQIDADPALHFIHVVLPHAPWFITPWGTTLMHADARRGTTPNGGDDVAWSSADPLPAALAADRRRRRRPGPGHRPPRGDRRVGRRHGARHRRPRHQHDPARRRTGGHRRTTRRRSTACRSS